MKYSEHYNLNLVDGSDLVNPLVQDVPNYKKIDEQMWENACFGVPTATELKSGNVHALTRTNSNANMFRFVATSNYSVGDVFTVDGTQVTGLLADGTTLGTNSFVTNANVLCCLVGSQLTLYVPSGSVAIAEDSKKLNGQSADYYATESDLATVSETANNANAVTLDLKNKFTAQIGNLIFVKLTQSEYDALSTKDTNTVYIIVEG